MKKEIFRKTLLLCTVAILLCSAVSVAILQRERKDEQVASVVSGLRALSENAQGQTSTEDFNRAARTFSSNYDGARLTIVDQSGRVVGDSHEDPATMENHGDREEIAEAKKSGVGVSERWSDTLKGRLRYVAVQADNGYIYRASVRVRSLNQAFVSILPAAVISILAAVLFSALGAKVVAKKIAHPVEEIVEGLQNIDNGDYSRLPLPDCDELASLVVSINTLSENIDYTLKDLRGERQKTLFLLDNVQEGLLALDKDTRVITVNRAAAAFLQVPPGRVAGQTISHLTTNKALIDAVLAAVEGPESLGSAFDLDDREGEKALLCSVLPVQADWIEGGQGAIVVLRDVTEERRRQQMRSEFFQNASHELKTPITSIGGFAQLLQSGMVTEEETRQRYLHNIEKETGRMAELIGDILKISRYEEGEVPRNELVDLEAVAGEVMERLQPVADRQGISLEMASRGDDLRLWGSKKDMEDLIGNLCDNAVKYNRPGGSVRVLLTALPEEVQIAVEDTGVGIPAAHLSRVFERFYRVEKDRNKKVGGTGLGLAIVKHICALYGGRVDIQSAEGRGTTVTAVLRRER